MALNAGNVNIGPADALTDEDFENHYNLNALHVVYLTKALVGQMLARAGRSAIMITSSGFSRLPTPGFASYCATKALVSTFGEAFSYEVQDRIDVLAWDCGSVTTNLNKSKGSFTMTPERAVDGALSQLGKSRVTDGSLLFEM